MCFFKILFFFLNFIFVSVCLRVYKYTVYMKLLKRIEEDIGPSGT